MNRNFPNRCVILAGGAFLLLCGRAALSAPIPAAAMETSVSGVSQPRATRVPAKSPAPALVGAARELRVMTFNLRVRTILDGPNIWDRRRDAVVQRVRSFNPDLLGTQEGLDSMQAFLRQQLTDYTFNGVGRSDGKLRGEMCGVFFRTARFELLDAGHFWLSKTPEQPGSRGWGAIFPRMVTWVKLRPRDGGQPFCWFNTHFDAFNGRARTESAGLLCEQMGRIAGGMPLVVTGDFNTSPNSAPYRTLLAEQRLPAASLHDVFRAAHPAATRQEGTMHLFTGRPGGRRMDWILASAHFQTVDAEIDRTRGPGGYPSDHFPVVTTLRVPAATRPRLPVARLD